jgi:hypothetical protein
MASDVDICNLALGHLGDEANVQAISPTPDGSIQADHCARFYPIARDQMLSGHAWNFASKRVALAVLDTDELPGTWAYAYALPSQCLRALAVIMPVTASLLIQTSQFSGFPPIPNTPDDNATQDFVIEALQDGTLAVFTNVYQAELRYIERITDTTKFSPAFTTALARLLASYLAGPIIKGSEGMKVAQAQMGVYKQLELPAARSEDATARKQNLYNNFIPDGLKARA